MQFARCTRPECHSRCATINYPGAVITPTPGAVITPTPGAVITPIPGAVITPAPGAEAGLPPFKSIYGCRLGYHPSKAWLVEQKALPPNFYKTIMLKDTCVTIWTRTHTLLIIPELNFLLPLPPQRI